MKKILSFIMAGCAMMSLVSCGRKTTSESPSTVSNNFNYKVGVASYTHTKDTYGYTEGKNGKGTVVTTNVAAVFAPDGKIVKIQIDETESNFGFDGKGQLVGYKAGEIKSKKEQRDAYGMKAVSGIGKEWYEQVEGLENWLVGKNVKDIVNGMTATDKKEPKNNTSNSTNNNSNVVNDNSNATMNGNGVAEDIMNGAENIANGVANTVDDLFGGKYSTNWMDTDIRAGVTIDTKYIRHTIEKAYKNAK